MTRRDDFQIDGEGITRALEDGSIERVAWRDLVEVALVTVDDGPFDEDLFFMLGDAEGNDCVIPGAQAAKLLPRLQRLPGFDNRQVMRAADCIDDARFVCWRGMPGQAVVCG